MRWQPSREELLEMDRRATEAYLLQKARERREAWRTFWILVAIAVFVMAEGAFGFWWLFCRCK